MYKKIIIDGIETAYSVSDEGQVKNDNTGRILSTRNGTVQLIVGEKHTGTSVGKLVATAFIPKEEHKELVAHIDGDPTNNRLENLKWITNEENVRAMWEKRRANGTTGAGVKRGPYKKKENIVEIQTYNLCDNEKQIVIDGELYPYSVNTKGEVKNLKTGKYLKGSILHSYRYINFKWQGHNKNKAVHQLVATAFIPNPNNYKMVDHINGDRLNNNVENLRWVSAEENANNIHRDMTPKPPEFEEVVLTEEEIKNERWVEYQGYMVSDMGTVIGKKGEVLDGNKSTIGYIKYGNKLGHILIWEAFNGPKKEGMVINHINGNKHDNRLSNLEEVTHQENMIKAANETNTWGFRKVGKYDDDGNLLEVFANATAASKEAGILPSSMRNTIRRNGKCHNGYSYRYIENE